MRVAAQWALTGVLACLGFGCIRPRLAPLPPPSLTETGVPSARSESRSAQQPIVIRTLPDSEIESVEIIKGAAAATLYGMNAYEPHYPLIIRTAREYRRTPGRLNVFVLDDSAWKAVGGSAVTLTPLDVEASSKSVITKADGFARFDSLSSRRYRRQVTHAGFLPRTDSISYDATVGLNSDVFMRRSPK